MDLDWDFDLDYFLSMMTSLPSWFWPTSIVCCLVVHTLALSCLVEAEQQSDYPSESLGKGSLAIITNVSAALAVISLVLWAYL